MIRHFISQARIQTTEGRLPIEMFITTDDVVSGWQGYVDPPQLKTIPSAMAKFIYGLQQGAIHGLIMVPGSTYEENLRMWNMAIQTAKTPPAKIAKLGEVWEYAGHPGTFPSGLFIVASNSALVPHAMLYMETGSLFPLSVGAQVDGGIELGRPDDWTCHGLLTDLIAKGKA